MTQLIYSENLGKHFEKGHLGKDDQQDAKFRYFTRSQAFGAVGGLLTSSEPPAYFKFPVFK